MKNQRTPLSHLRARMPTEVRGLHESADARVDHTRHAAQARDGILAAPSPCVAHAAILSNRARIATRRACVPSPTRRSRFRGR